MPLQVFCRNCAQYRNEWCKLKVDSPDPDMVRNCQYYRGMTNADRIRAMTDEELAVFVEGSICPGGVCPLGNETDVSKPSCQKCWLDWLRQEAGG